MKGHMHADGVDGVRVTLGQDLVDDLFEAKAPALSRGLTAVNEAATGVASPRSAPWPYLALASRTWWKAVAGVLCWRV